MAIQIFASDLDGTLLNKKSRISDETAKAVKRAQRAGKYFMTVTGRSWNTVHGIFQAAGIEAEYILLNGAEFRTSSGKVIYQEAIDMSLAEKIMEYLVAVGIDFEVNTDNGDFSTDTKLCNTAFELQNCAQIINHSLKILKFFVFSEDMALLEKVKRYLKEQEGLSVTSSAIWNVEITAAAAEKGKMLKRAAQFYGIPNEEVMVFGDGENDKRMFQEFAHSCAVKNAVPAVRKLAEKIIESNEENGVAKEINRILEYV